jgi:solute carrier family 13 (sodium-dependent dicarboxylate transporter), member 2/3/5
MLVIGVIVGAIVFLTELNSNTATSATFIPIASALAVVLGVSPLQLAIPVAMASNCSFMLPVATPANAIVFGSARVTVPQMMRAGFWLNILAVLLITLYLPWALRLVLG